MVFFMISGKILLKAIFTYKGTYSKAHFLPFEQSFARDHSLICAVKNGCILILDGFHKYYPSDGVHPISGKAEQ